MELSSAAKGEQCGNESCVRQQDAVVQAGPMNRAHRGEQGSNGGAGTMELAGGEGAMRRMQQ
jgi:hypothetical protein